TPGGHVRLGDVANVRIVAAPTVIRREAISPYLDILFDVQGRDVAAVTSDIKTTLQNFPFRLEYHAVLLGEQSTQQAAQQRILLAAVVAVIGIFLLLQASFDSWRLAAATFVTLPAALVGGALAAIAGGGPLSLGALFGLLAVLGITARHGVLLISHCRRLEQEGEPFGSGLALRGARERLAPMVMTTLTTGLILLPFVIFGDIPGLEVVRPMALVILGGLVTSTLLSLFVMPTLYLRFGARLASESSSLPLNTQPSLSSSAD
ncbi:MAG: efflux RND transporter permease subunit, partial [Chloroflexota bacterium]